MTWHLGRRWSSARTAALASFVLATMYMFWDKARTAQIDGVMCALIWVALTAFALWRDDALDGRRAGFVFWGAGALAVLAKGPVGLLLPLGIVLLTLVVDGELGRWRCFAPFGGPLLFAAICGAWVAAATLWGPSEYSVWGALQEHFVERGIHGMHHVEPWWYYAKVLPPQLLPWTFLVPGALLLAWRRRDRTDRFLLVVVFFIVLFFSISTEKRTLYVLPAFPAFALLTARFVGALVGWDKGPRISHRWLTVGQSVLAGLFCLLGAAAPFAAERVDEFPAWVLWVLASTLLVIGVATFIAVASRRLLGAALTPAVGLAVLYLVIASVVFPMANDFKSGREFAGVLREAVDRWQPAGQRVLACDIGNLTDQYAFYSDGVYFIRTNEVTDLAAYLHQQQRVLAVINQALIEELPQRQQQRLEVLATTHGSRRDIALIANRPTAG
jgi:4-amino-4-deoxy-L-arabinose transferase-like glycosyltransferase